uniref:Epidermal growth factor receptor pathway substrate 15-like 1a n=1 Tax=Oncorhynchus tshawytscha TaxID=74940 RepID=A0A8C8HGZ5_ONCTS
NFYRQVDPGNTGRVGPTEAALFLKKSGLPDVTLGKIWDLADPDGKGFLDKRVENESFPLCVIQRIMSLPLLVNGLLLFLVHFLFQPEEKGKFDGIFESLAPVSGLLSGDKVKPVLTNSKLPLDVLGKVWDLSDIDKDGHLDRDEFAVAMHLVYRALEKEPVPSVLPSSLIPPNKRKKSLVGSLPGMVPMLSASPPPPKDSLRSTPSHGSMNSLNSAGSLSPKYSLKSAQHSVNWVVPVTDRGRYDDIFLKTDLDVDGFVSGMEVKDIFMHSGLPQNLLAHIWALADTRQMGKLTREQFALAMHFIQQKVSKGMDPPQALTPDMIPPSERGTPVPDSSSSVGSGSEFTGIKELDDISQEIAQLQREKYTLEQDIRETEEAIRHKSSEVQEMQNDLDRETCSLQELEAQKQEAQERLEEMDQQKAKLEDMLNDVRIKCNEESQMISSLQNQIHSQETDLHSQEEELSRAKADLNQLQLEESQLEQSLTAGKFQLETIIKSLKATQDEINQARSKLSQIQDSQQEMTKSIEQYNSNLNGTHGGSMTNLADMSEGFHNRENGGFGAMEDPFKVKTSGFCSVPQEMHTDPFHSEDPFKTDPFKGDPFQNDPFAKQPSLPAPPDPFGGDPFKETDPFKATSEDFFRKTTVKADPFSTPDPFSKNLFGTLDPFGSSTAFGSSNSSFGSKSTPVNMPGGAGDSTKPCDPFQPFGSDGIDPFQSKKGVGDPFSGKDPFAPSASSKASKDCSLGFADFSSFGNEAQQLEWAKRESERAERERLKRLRQQEQEDLELAIALSKAEMSHG